MVDPYVLAVDQGTSSTKAIAMDASGQVVRHSSVPIGKATPRPGWVEQDPIEIADSVVRALREVTRQLPGTCAAVGLSSQRESALAWDTDTKQPLSPLLGWQDRRMAALAQNMLATGTGDEVRRRTGLPLDPMFSALKLSWILDEIDPSRRRANNGDIRLGTVDAWLLDTLTGEYRIEAGNASRTQLMNIHTVEWDQDLLSLFGIPPAALPPIVPSNTLSPPIVGVDHDIVWGAVMGDSHAALFGHGVRTPGTVKATYGTGSSVMGLSPQDVAVGSGLTYTMAWLDDQPHRGFEGNILSTGGTLAWLASVFDVTPTDLDQWARTVPDSGDVYLVPAFEGLGAPYWQSQAKAVMCGFHLGTTRAHLARASFESIAHQIEDVLMSADIATGQQTDLVLADGGPSSNDWLMQLQADVSGRVVGHPDTAVLSATGAAHMAGRTVGFWADHPALTPPVKRFVPRQESSWRERSRAAWSDAIGRTSSSSPSSEHLYPSGRPS